MKRTIEVNSSKLELELLDNNQMKMTDLDSGEDCSYELTNEDYEVIHNLFPGLAAGHLLIKIGRAIGRAIGATDPSK